MTKRDAVALLNRLSAGQMVRVRFGTDPYEMRVTRSPHRADGPHGSWESTQVEVTLMDGFWTTKVTVEHLASGQVSVEVLS